MSLAPKTKVGVQKVSGVELNEMQFKQKLIVFEGKIDHFYCDSKGLVTCGVGSLVDPFYAPQNLLKISMLEFHEPQPLGPTVFKSTATAQDGNTIITYTSDENKQKIYHSYDSVKSKLADPAAARSITNLRISEASYMKLFDNYEYKNAALNAKNFYSHLPASVKFRTFDSLPVNVQWALIDLGFNLSPDKLNVFQQLKTNLAAGNFVEAAKQSHRKLGKDKNGRNQTIHDWIAMYGDQRDINKHNG